MSQPSENLRQRLLAHLLDQSSEEDQRQIELAALEDDDFFDQLRAAEAELLETYVQGELDETASLRLAELVGLSPRLQESAETTLALHWRESMLDQDRGPSTATDETERRLQPSTPAVLKKHRAGKWLTGSMLAILLFVLILGLWQISNLRRDLQQTRSQVESLIEDRRSLEAQLELQQRRIERLQQEHLRLERRWAESADSGKK